MEALNGSFQSINHIKKILSPIINNLEADVLDLNITIKYGKFISNVYNKRDMFEFTVVRPK